MERAEVETRVGPVPVRITGSGPVVLAVHGALVDGRLWDDVVPLVAPSARLVAPDLPLGAQRRAVPDRSRLTPENVAGALLDVLDGLGIDETVLLGNDTGGALAQMAAAAAPHRVAGLVLAGCDAFEHFPPPLLRPLPALARIPGATRLVIGAVGVPALFADPGRLNLFTVRGFERELVRDWLHPARTDPAVRADLTALLRRMSPQPLLAAAERLADLRAPAEVVWGRRDRIFPPRDAERLAALLGCSVTWLDDAVTFVPRDRPDAVADAVTRVLATAVR